MAEPQLTANIQKGGALLDDARRLIEVWDVTEPAPTNVERIVKDNLLAKGSRVRADDVMRRILGPRYVEPGTHVIEALKALLTEPTAFAEASYYETTRDDALLRTFVDEKLTEWWDQGRRTIDVREVADWLRLLGEARRAPVWTQTMRTKTARGLLAALRDFGVLRGANRKEIAPRGMTPRGFVYVAWRETERGVSASRLANGPVWKRWLLSTEEVAELFALADRSGALRLQRAGTAARIDWRAETLEEAVLAGA